MSVRTAQTSLPDPRAAAAELASALAPGDGSLVLYFASSSYPQAELAAVLHAALSPAQTFGCSTAGEIASGAVSKRSIVAICMTRDAVEDFDVRLIDRIGDDAALAGALRGFEAHFGEKMAELDATTHVGIVLMDGLSRGEERFLDRLGNATDLFFVGGSAGDDLAFKQTHVHAGGKVSAHGAVLAVLRPRHGFEIIKTQSFDDSGRTLVATRVDESTRTVLEFNGRPATEAYAAAIGTTADKLAESFGMHPMGLMDGAEPFVRSPAQVTGSGVSFFCAVKEGTELALLNGRDFVSETDRVIAEKVNGGAAGLIVFNCILRTLELERRHATDAYGKVFERVPTVGFSTYGEAYIGHVNQTATMLLLK